MNSLPDKEMGVNLDSMDKKWGRQINTLLVYIVIFLILLLLGGLYELKKAKPVERPFQVEEGK